MSACCVVPLAIKLPGVVHFPGRSAQRSAQILATETRPLREHVCVPRGSGVCCLGRTICEKEPEADNLLFTSAS